MRRLTHLIVDRLLAGVQRRFVRSRAGSVLIMVVALLVILALIGTAWMATARNDRYGAAQNITNTQIDLLVEGAIALAQGEIVDDLFGTVGGTEVYRPSGDAATTGYGHYDVASAPSGFESDTWLAARVPVDDGGVGWRALSAPFNEDAADTNVPKRPYFHDPRSTGFVHFEIAPKAIGYPDVEAHGGKDFPSLRFGVNEYIAGDADGDGIADSVLWKLPIAPIDGVTYYVAYRIIDNNSAVNANIAASANEPVIGLAGNFFPTNVSLLRMLRHHNVAPYNITPTDQMQALTEYRFDDVAANIALNYNNALRDDGTAGGFDFQSPYDALWMQYGRRPNNPGLNHNGVPFQGLSIADSMALAYHFCLINPDASRSQIEEYLDGSLYESAPNFNLKVKAYAANAVGDSNSGWYGENFAYETEDHTTNPADTTTFMPIRALLTASNPVASVVTDAPLVAGMGTYGTIPVKVPLTSAEFEDLYRAFWSVMAERWTTSTGTVVPGTPFGATEDPTTGAGIVTAPVSPLVPADVYQGSRIGAALPDTHPYRMFRSAARDPQAPTFTAYFPPEQMMRIRAAVAAANALDLRDTDNNVSDEQIGARINIGGTPTDVNVIAYGTENQVYITEVFAQTDTSAYGGVTPAPANNPFGYIAIELYNPHGEPVSVMGWKLAVIERLNTGGTYPNLTTTGITVLGDLDDLMVNPVKEIPAGEYLILENYQPEDAVTADVTAAEYRPGSQNLPVEEITDDSLVTPPGEETVFVPNLHLAFNQELVILRPVMQGTKNEPIENMVPVDQYDFTGLALPDGLTVLQARVWHYVRANGSGDEWKCVYPGRYDAHQTVPAAGLPQPRQEGTDVSPAWTPDSATFTILDEWDPARVGGIQVTTVLPDPVVNMNGSDSTAGYDPKVFDIQLTNAAWAGPNPSTPPAFPFGNFARNGDVFQVPFIGAYRVYVDTDGTGTYTPLGGDTLIELNSVTMDASFAEDTDHTNDAAENLGRFCPIDPRDLTTAKAIGDATAESDDFNDEGEYGDPDDVTKPNVWRYRWAMDIFDYLTVQAPHRDYFPEAHNAGFAGTPVEVDSDGNGTANDDPERALPIQGLVNINTAPWKVLASLPMVLNPINGEIDWIANVRLAQEIVRFRDVDDGSGQPFGPFRSIFDLNRVLDSTDPEPNLALKQGFRDAMNTMADMTAYEADDNDGDLSPTGQGSPDGVLNDFETRFLVLNRISNLITTRSDSFTAYILIQGWRNAETPGARLEAQRRVGVIFDRSGVVSTTTKANISATRFPQN